MVEGRNLFSAMSKDLMKFMILTVLGKQKEAQTIVSVYLWYEFKYYINSTDEG